MTDRVIHLIVSCNVLVQRSQHDHSNHSREKENYHERVEYTKHTHTYLHTYIYIYIHIYNYTYIHTYIHTHTYHHQRLTSRESYPIRKRTTHSSPRWGSVGRFPVVKMTNSYMIVMRRYGNLGIGSFFFNPRPQFSFFF